MPTLDRLIDEKLDRVLLMVKQAQASNAQANAATEVVIKSLRAERDTYLESATRLQAELDRRSDEEYRATERVIDERRANCECPLCGDPEWHEAGCELGAADAEIERLRAELEQAQRAAATFRQQRDELLAQYVE